MDVELVQTLRRQNLTKYAELVTLHLSFVTQGFNAEQMSGFATTLHGRKSISPKEKSPPFKLGTPTSTPRKKLIQQQSIVSTSCSPLKARLAKSAIENHLFGANLTQEGIAAAQQLIDYLKSNNNLKTEGLFRVSGNTSKVHRLKDLLCSGESLNFSQFSSHDVASTLKLFLAELPDYLLSSEHYPVYSQIADFDRTNELSKNERIRANQKRLTSITLLVMLLPVENAQLLKLLLEFLSEVSEESEHNRMNAENLSMMFVPVLFRVGHEVGKQGSAKKTAEDYQRLSLLLKLMICHPHRIFRCPRSLLLDIANAVECLDGKGGNEESTCVAFVDREKSAQDSQHHSTDQALAELHATIQSLPDGHKMKKKLLKRIQDIERKKLGATPDGLGHKSRRFFASVKKRIFSTSSRGGSNESIIAENEEEADSLKSSSVRNAGVMACSSDTLSSIGTDGLSTQSLVDSQEERSERSMSEDSNSVVSDLSWNVLDDATADIPGTPGSVKHFVSRAGCFPFPLMEQAFDIASLLPEATVSLDSNSSDENTTPVDKKQPQLRLKLREKAQDSPRLMLIKNQQLVSSSSLRNSKKVTAHTPVKPVTTEF